MSKTNWNKLTDLQIEELLKKRIGEFGCIKGTENTTKILAKVVSVYRKSDEQTSDKFKNFRFRIILKGNSMTSTMECKPEGLVFTK